MQIISSKIKYKNALLLFVLMMIEKISLEWSYVYVLSEDKVSYPISFSILKYIYGFAWLIILFFLIRHDIKKPSTFLLQFFFVMEIIPLTIIFSFQNESFVYYSCVCLGMLLCELLILPNKSIKITNIKINMNKFFVFFGLLLLFVFLFEIYKNNGLPSLTAINIYNVYELRGSGLYVLNKYWSYLQSLLILVVIPLLLTSFIIKKKYFGAILVFFAELIIYLYAGQKSFIFIGLMVVVISIWAKREKFEREFWPAFLGGITLLSFLSKHRLVYLVYSLFCRRVMFVSANNKFIYFDFFSKNEKLGFSGIFPTWIVPLKEGLSEDFLSNYSYIISDIYYGHPEMNSNTGFLAEGYMRWGFCGLFISFIVFSLFLMYVDYLNETNSYEFALGCSIGIVFFISDTFFISRILFGSYTIWIFVTLFLFGNVVNRKKKIAMLHE